MGVELNLFIREKSNSESPLGAKRHREEKKRKQGST